MKITAKTTKEQLKTFLGLNASAVKKEDKDLYQKLLYADKMLKKDESKVTRKDLTDLAKEVMTLLGDKIAEITTQEKPVVAENSVKKLNSKKKEEVKEADSEYGDSDSEETTEEVDNKKSAKKSLGGKKTSKKDGATALEGSENPKTVQFPQVFEVEDRKYELATDIQNMEDLYKALNNEEEIVFAFYYSKKMLKQAPYFYDVLGHPKSFEHDLDLATTIYVSEEMRVAYHISIYTEGCYNTLPEDFEEVDGVRYAGTMEFQIYRVV